MRRIFAIILAVGIIAGLTLATFYAVHGARSRVVTLSNGYQLELLGTAVGGATFTTEKPWQKQARKILPARWQNWIPSPLTGSCGSGANSVTLYFQARNPAGGAIVNWEDCVTQDDDGFTYRPDGGYCIFSGATPGSSVRSLTLRAFPRRQPRFTFHLLGAAGVVLAKFEVENPVHGPFPEWQPLPMPQTRTNGPVTLTLESLREAGNPPWNSITPKWKLSSTETNWSKAHSRYITLLDSAGNEGSRLSPREKAWKIRTQVFREYLQDFGANEYIALTNVPVPAPGENIYAGAPIERNGVTLTIHAVGGQGAIANTNGASWEMVLNHPGGTGESTRSSGNTTIEEWSSLKPFLLVGVRNAQVSDEIRFQLRDDLGREVKLEDSGYSGFSNGGRTYMRRFTPATDAKSLSLEIIVNRPLEFEFMVNPADVNTAKK